MTAVKFHFKFIDVILYVTLGLACLSGCAPTQTEIMDWSNLHRVGPGANIRVYYWDATYSNSDGTKGAWRLSRNKVSIPEGHYIGPPPQIGEAGR